MPEPIDFVLSSILLGVGLAMDAFSVSLANGLREPHMGKLRMGTIAGVFGGFQALMPLVGWFCVHTVAQAFAAVQPFIPWTALLLLSYIGGKMLVEGLRTGDDEEPAPAVGLGGLLLQGVATSIDALSVGFTIVEYSFPMALSAALLIAAVTFLICLMGLRLGKTFGTRLSRGASILGGVILIAIGLRTCLGGIGFF